MLQGVLCDEGGLVEPLPPVEPASRYPEPAVREPPGLVVSRVVVADDRSRELGEMVLDPVRLPVWLEAVDRRDVVLPAACRVDEHPSFLLAVDGLPVPVLLLHADDVERRLVGVDDMGARGREQYLVDPLRYRPEVVRGEHAVPCEPVSRDGSPPLSEKSLDAVERHSEDELPGGRVGGEGRGQQGHSVLIGHLSVGIVLVAGEPDDRGNDLQLVEHRRLRVGRGGSEYDGLRAGYELGVEPVEVPCPLLPASLPFLPLRLPVGVVLVRACRDLPSGLRILGKDGLGGGVESLEKLLQEPEPVLVVGVECLLQGPVHLGKLRRVLLVLPLEGDDGVGERSELGADLPVAELLDVYVFHAFIISESTYIKNIKRLYLSK